jgi:hypothetical protein
MIRIKGNFLPQSGRQVPSLQGVALRPGHGGGTLPIVLPQESSAR